MSKLGLVCLTSTGEPKFRTITKTRLEKLSREEQVKVLVDIYIDNISSLDKMIQFCIDNKIQLYRLSSQLFPFADSPLGRGLLFEFATRLEQIGERFIKAGIRVTAHPDKFVSLVNTDPKIIRNSIDYLEMHSNIFNLLQLEQSSWNPIIIHCGKRDNKIEFIQAVKYLSSSIRDRLVIENDEYSYGAKDICDISRMTGIPVVFDLHHHIVKEKVQYSDPSIGQWLDTFKETWDRTNNVSWQLCHISNGADHLWDNKHSDFIKIFPEDLFNIEWIEVEAKQKEQAIFHLRREYPNELE